MPKKIVDPDLSTPEKCEAYWNQYAVKKLVGRTIKSVSYMTKKEADELAIRNRPVVIELDDGQIIYPMSDDEGNDGGAMHSNGSGFPVLR